MRTQLALLSTLIFTAAPAMAVDYLVTRTDDPALNSLSLTPCLPSGGCTLRQAVLATNKRIGADRILLSRKTYNLSLSSLGGVIDGKTGPLWVTDDLQIVGAGAALTRVRWNASIAFASANPLIHQSRASANAELPALRVLSLSLSDGRGISGGCIYSEGSVLDLSDSVIENCRADTGGAVYLASPSLNLSRAILRGNQATTDGGAIVFTGQSYVIGDGAQLLNNTALRDGGALYASSRSLPDGSITYSSTSWYSDNPSTRFVGNSAGRNGGAIALTVLALMDLHGNSTVNQPIIFESNVAAARGGAIDLSAPIASTQPTLRFELHSARLSGNAAAVGGAIASRGWIYLYSSEFISNSAQAGSGGAVALDYASTSNPGKAHISTSSFTQNSASGSGGAIASSCQQLQVVNSSLYANSAQTQGEAISASGNTLLTHVTTDGHGAANFGGPSSLHKSYNTACGAQEFLLTNNLIAGTDSCYAPGAGYIGSRGGNQYGPGAGGCYHLPGLDQGQANANIFGLSLGYFGATKQILGWNNDGQIRPQRNFSAGTYCTGFSFDIRGLPRNDGACDAGAFEQQ